MSREDEIKKIIEVKTNRKYEIIESKKYLIVRFEKTEEEKDIMLREELEKELLGLEFSGLRSDLTKTMTILLGHEGCWLLYWNGNYCCCSVHCNLCFITFQ